MDNIVSVVFFRIISSCIGVNVVKLFESNLLAAVIKNIKKTILASFLCHVYGERYLFFTLK